MHALVLSVLFALGGLKRTLSLSLPSNLLHTPSTYHNILNATQPNIQAWPPTPFAHPITENIFIKINRYGRRVCRGDTNCEEQIQSDMNGLGWKLIFDYEPGAKHAYSFASGDVYLTIKQELATDNGVVLKVLHALKDLTWDHGATEVLGASIVNGSEVLARFMLTFPEL